MYSFCAKVFRFNIESWPEWESNPQPRAYREIAFEIAFKLMNISDKANIK